jgi:hypothetical protein
MQPSTHCVSRQLPCTGVGDLAAAIGATEDLDGKARTASIKIVIGRLLKSGARFHTFNQDAVADKVEAI